jgi:hypothetical protein
VTGVIQLGQTDDQRAPVIDDAAEVATGDVGADVLDALVDVDRVAAGAEVLERGIDRGQAALDRDRRDIVARLRVRLTRRQSNICQGEGRVRVQFVAGADVDVRRVGVPSPAGRRGVLRRPTQASGHEQPDRRQRGHEPLCPSRFHRVLLPAIPAGFQLQRPRAGANVEPA